MLLSFKYSSIVFSFLLRAMAPIVSEPQWTKCQKPFYVYYHIMFHYLRGSLKLLAADEADGGICYCFLCIFLSTKYRWRWLIIPSQEEGFMFSGSIWSICRKVLKYSESNQKESFLCADWDGWLQYGLPQPCLEKQKSMCGRIVWTPSWEITGCLGV